MQLKTTPSTQLHLLLWEFYQLVHAPQLVLDSVHAEEAEGFQVGGPQITWSGSRSPAGPSPD